MKEQTFFSRLNKVPELREDLVVITLTNGDMLYCTIEKATRANCINHQHIDAKVIVNVQDDDPTLSPYMVHAKQLTILVKDIATIKLANDLESHVPMHKTFCKNKSYWLEKEVTINASAKQQKQVKKQWQAPAMPRRFVKSLNKSANFTLFM